MGSGASKKGWQSQYHLTTNVPDPNGEAYNQIFPVWTIAVTNNMKQLASATGPLDQQYQGIPLGQMRIHLWCVLTHRLLISLGGHADTVWRLAYSPDDAFLASASADGTVRLWEVETGHMVGIMPRMHSNWVWSLAWAPDSSRFASGGSDTRILVWNGPEAIINAEAVGEKRDMALQDPSWDKVADELVQATAARTVPMVGWQAHDKSVHDLVFAQDSRRLVSSSADGTLAVWDSDTGSLEFRLNGHLGNVPCITMDPTNDDLVATGGEDHTVRIWDLKDIPKGSSSARVSREKSVGYNLQHFTLKGHTGGVLSVRFSSDGTLLASASKDCEVRIWNPDPKGPTLNSRFVAHEAWITALVWLPDMSNLFTGSSDGLIMCWEVPGKFHRNLDAEEAQKDKKKGKKKYKA